YISILVLLIRSVLFPSLVGFPFYITNMVLGFIKPSTTKNIRKIHITTPSRQRLALPLPFFPPDHIYQPKCSRHSAGSFLHMQCTVNGLIRKKHIPRDGSQLAVQNRIV